MVKRELNKKTSELLLTVTANKDEWKKEQDIVFKDLSSKLTLKGFRKGQVPAEIAKKSISVQDIQAKAIKKLLDTMVREAAKEIKKEDIILDSPTYKVDKISDAELEVTFVYPLYPTIKLSNYKNLNIKFKKKNLSEDVIKTEIDRLLNQQAMLVVKDGPIAKTDSANFDFEGFVDGKAFDGGTAKGYELEIGSGQFIPGFEDQMIGLKKGDKKDVKVTFPKEYHSEELKGKEATFKVVINDVKAKEMPKLDDEFVKSSGVPNVSTVAELKAYIKEIFGKQEEMNARAKFQREVFENIKSKTELALPTSLVVKEMQNIAKQFEEEVKKQGMDIATYKKTTGLDDTALTSRYKAQAEERLKDSLIFAEISKLEKIELKDADYATEYKKLAKVYNQTEDAIKKMITKEQMQVPMTNDKVIDALIKYNK